MITPYRASSGLSKLMNRMTVWQSAVGVNQGSMMMAVSKTRGDKTVKPTKTTDPNGNPHFVVGKSVIGGSDTVR